MAPNNPAECQVVPQPKLKKKVYIGDKIPLLNQVLSGQVMYTSVGSRHLCQVRSYVCLSGHEHLCQVVCMPVGSQHLCQVRSYVHLSGQVTCTSWSSQVICIFIIQGCNSKCEWYTRTWVDILCPVSVISAPNSYTQRPTQKLRLVNASRHSTTNQVIDASCSNWCHRAGKHVDSLTLLIQCLQASSCKWYGCHVYESLLDVKNRAKLANIQCPNWPRYTAGKTKLLTCVGVPDSAWVCCNMQLWFVWCLLWQSVFLDIPLLKVWFQWQPSLYYRTWGYLVVCSKLVMSPQGHIVPV